MRLAKNDAEFISWMWTLKSPVREPRLFGLPRTAVLAVAAGLLVMTVLLTH
mgnify:FL=1